MDDDEISNALEVERRVALALARAYPQLSEQGHALAMAEARRCPAYLCARAGSMPVAVGEVVDWVRTSTFGTLVSGQEVKPGRTDHAAALAGLSAQDQIAYARRHGLT